LKFLKLNYFPTDMVVVETKRAGQWKQMPEPLKKGKK
jgi:hypothetical protein